MTNLVKRDYVTRSVLGGWRTFIEGTNIHVGPVLTSTEDLWEWQRRNLYHPKKVACRDEFGSWTIPAYVKPELAKVVKEAIDGFGHLIGYGESVTAPEFAALLEEHNSGNEETELSEKLREFW